MLYYLSHLLENLFPGPDTPTRHCDFCRKRLPHPRPGTHFCSQECAIEAADAQRYSM